MAVRRSSGRPGRRAHPARRYSVEERGPVRVALLGRDVVALREPHEQLLPDRAVVGETERLHGRDALVEAGDPGLDPVDRDPPTPGAWLTMPPQMVQ